MRLQAKILLVVMPLAVLPLLGLGWLAYSQLQGSAEQRSVGQMTTLLDQLGENVGTRFDIALANVRLFADASLVRTYALTEDEEVRYILMLPSVLKLFKSYLRAFPDYYEIRILLPDGYEDVRATLQRIPNASEEEGDTSLFQALDDFEGEVLSRALTNPDNGEISLQVARPLRLINPAIDDPVRAAPTLRGYLIVTMSLDFVAEQIRTNRIGNNGMVFLMDRAGKIRFHRDPARVGSRVAPALLTELLAHAERTAYPGEYGNHSVDHHAHAGGGAFFGDFASQPAVLGVRALHDDLLLVGVLPELELLAESRELGSAVLWITLVTVLLTSLSLLYALRTLLIEPMRRLMWAASEIGRGNLTPELGPSSQDELGRLTTSFRDMGRSLQESHNKAQYLAYHDSLTGLPNRLMFLEYLQHMIALARREDNTMAVLFLDLDNFKRVNDTLGHPIGDQLLKDMADRLSSLLRAEDVVCRKEPEEAAEVLARLGGDEFIILLPRINDSSDAATVASRILEVMKEPFQISRHELYNGASIGITLYPSDGNTASDLVKRADVAMYHAKGQGRNNFQFYSASYNLATYEHMALENQLRRALDNGELELYYQPQVEADTGRIIGLEALLRWNHPELGMVPPSQFIPMAEASGLILPVGEWVLRQACRQNRAWQEAGLPAVFVSVNVSGVQFQRQDLSPIVKSALQETGLKPRFLEVEVTETALMQVKQDVINKLSAMKQIGLSISMDDFGTGYSSLNYLRMFPIDKLKIDRSFVRDMESEPQDAGIVAAILSIASNLGLETTAEGVETPGQLAMLREGGCNYIQGYLFSRPMPARDVPQLLTEQRYLVPGGARIGEKAKVKEA